MNDLSRPNDGLVILNDQNTPTTTSLIVAEAFGKEHKHVMDTIRAIVNTLELNKIDGSNFRLISYKDSMNRTKPCFELDRNAYAQLVNGFTGEKATVFRKKYADAFDAMEESLSKPKKLTRMEILQMAMESEQKVLNLEHQAMVDYPKVEAFDSFMNEDGLISLTEGLKNLGLKPRVTMKWMCENTRHIYSSYRGDGSYTKVAYQSAIGHGLFVIKRVRIGSGRGAGDERNFTPVSYLGGN